MWRYRNQSDTFRDRIRYRVYTALPPSSIKATFIQSLSLSPTFPTIVQLQCYYILLHITEAIPALKVGCCERAIITALYQKDNNLIFEIKTARRSPAPVTLLSACKLPSVTLLDLSNCILSLVFLESYFLFDSKKEKTDSFQS